MSKVTTGQASSTLIPKYIGSDFDKVVAVADNIEQVVIVGDNIEDVGTVADNINYVKEVAEDLHGMPVTMYTGETPPVLNPMPEGVMWYCTTDGRTYVWYTDADSGQWVESAPQSAMKDEATNIFFHSVPSNVNPAYRSATLYSSPAPEAEISVAHNALNTPVVQAQFIREEALWVDVSVTGAQGIVTLMGYSSGNSQLKAEIITWKNGAEGTSLGASQWVTLPNQPSVVSLPVTLANIDVLDAGDSYVVKLTSQMNAGGSAISTILVDGNTNSRFGIIFNTNLIGLNDKQFGAVPANTVPFCETFYSEPNMLVQTQFPFQDFAMFSYNINIVDTTGSYWVRGIVMGDEVFPLSTGQKTVTLVNVDGFAQLNIGIFTGAATYYGVVKHL